MNDAKTNDAQLRLDHRYARGDLTHRDATVRTRLRIPIRIRAFSVAVGKSTELWPEESSDSGKMAVDPGRSRESPFIWERAAVLAWG